ncbi:MAG: hypothetical protein EXX96DRAFT_558201 [Benjaminiella poitrasii]|nr:MAG: hypothetical protein EXX96DRAFT_558201 [Benjaminiella poitrasii]
MSNKPSDSGTKKSNQPNKPSAISKHVLKTTPIPQPVQSASSSNLTRNLRVFNDKSKVKPTQPLRSTKVSQKLVLFPQSTVDDVETSMQSTLPTDSGTSFNNRQHETHAAMSQLRRTSTNSLDEHHQQQWQDEQNQPRTAGVPLPIEWTFGSRTAAERMTKDERELALLPRAAAYCTGEGYNLTRLRRFLRQHHHVSPRLYDECLYAAYHFPLRTLRPGKNNPFNIRVRSNVSKPPNSRRNTVDDEEEMNYDEDHFDRADAPVVVQPVLNETYSEYYQNRKDYYDEDEEEQQLLEESQQNEYSEEQETPLSTEQNRADEAGIFKNPFAEENNKSNDFIPDEGQHPQEDRRPTEPQLSNEEVMDNNKALNKQQQQDQPQDQQSEEHYHQHQQQQPREPFKGGEVFIFDYGVVVFWNFRRAEELLMLEDFMQFSIDPFRDNPDEDMQIEEIHFQYDTSQMKPRIFNDMITLKSSNHMIKLTLSHGLAQSAVLARYEDIMDKTIEDTKYLPKEMAETGRLGKTRAEITKINGLLFKLRMNVNLVSNVLDTPEIFWSEPALQPMYTAIRDYLEIPQRAKILNDRLRVISDLLSMLRDHLNNFGVEYQTLIIIYLIIIAVIVAFFEIGVKILQSIDVL